MQNQNGYDPRGGSKILIVGYYFSLPSLVEVLKNVLFIYKRGNRIYIYVCATRTKVDIYIYIYVCPTHIYYMETYTFGSYKNKDLTQSPIDLSHPTEYIETLLQKFKFLVRPHKNKMPHILEPTQTTCGILSASSRFRPYNDTARPFYISGTAYPKNSEKHAK